MRSPAQALQSVGQYLVRAVDDASDAEARTEMMYAAMLAGIAFNAAGCHLPHGLSYAVSGLVKDRHIDGYPDGQAADPARHGRRAEQSFGVAPHGAGASGSAICAARMRSARRSCGATPDDAGEVLAGRIIELMQRDAACRTAFPRSGLTKRTSTRSPKAPSRNTA